MEICIGCGAKAEKHPVVGIQKEGTSNSFGAKPIESHYGHDMMAVCHKCWIDPESRKTKDKRIKAAFFMRDDSKLAMRLVNLPVESNTPAGLSTVPKG